MVIKGKHIGKFYGGLLIGFIMMVFIGVILHNRKMHEYIDVREIDQLNGILVKIQAERSSAFGILEDGSKIFIFDSDNFNYLPYAINKFLKTGDSIVKHQESDSLYIFRNNQRFVFIVGETIGKQ